MLAFIKLTLVTFGLVYAAALSGLYVTQRELQYFPSRLDPAPDAMGLEGVERVLLTTPDGETLVLWHSPAPGGRPTVLFLHGNAGSIADRAQRLAYYQSRGLGAAFLSWRGYGGSSGRPSEAGLLADARTAYDFLVGMGIAPESIVLVGESLGSGAAVPLAATVPVGSVVLEAPFTSAAAVARLAYPWVPVGLLMKDQFRSSALIDQIDAPLLVLHGERDGIIPFAFGRALYAEATEPKTFLSLGPVGHAALSDPATWAHGADFIDGLFPP
jgi:fermentation-respiration switch protein FrsA (DUF1100 family)